MALGSYRLSQLPTPTSFASTFSYQSSPGLTITKDGEVYRLIAFVIQRAECATLYFLNFNISFQRLLFIIKKINKNIHFE